MLRTGSLRSALLCLPALLLFAPAGRADTTFTVTGMLANSSTVSGTITINTATGAVDGFDVTVAGAFNFTANMFGSSSSPFAGDWEIEGQTAFNPSASFVAIVLPVTTLVGFMGANICDVANPCNGNFVSDAGTVTNPPPNSSFTGGSLSAPEPSTMLLMIGGGAMLLAAKRRRAVIETRGKHPQNR